MMGVFYAMKAVGVLRVSEVDEMQGLDMTEHGQEAYGLSGEPA